MNYLTCRGCARDPKACPTRSNLSEKIAGLHITSLKFQCAARVPVFAPGDRVRVTWPFYFDGEDAENVTFLATIIKEAKPGRYYIRVDPGLSWSHGDDYLDCAAEKLSANGHAQVSMTRLEKHDEPPRRVCPACHGVEGIVDDCFADDQVLIPAECLRRALIELR